MKVSKDSRVHVATIGDNGVVTVVQDTNFRVGTLQDATKHAFVRRTYPAVYNHVVQNMNSLIKLTKEKDKRSMRGGHFLLYRYMVLLAFILCISFGVASIYVKACAAVPFILSITHILLSIYNIVIYVLNRPLLHPDLTIYLTPGEMPKTGWENLFYKAFLHTSVRTDALAAFVDPARIIAAIQLENTRVDEIQVMFYKNSYIPRSRFPKECAFYLILFFIMFILAIIFVASSAS